MVLCVHIVCWRLYVREICDKSLQVLPPSQDGANVFVRVRGIDKIRKWSAVRFT